MAAACPPAAALSCPGLSATDPFLPWSGMRRRARTERVLPAPLESFVLFRSRIAHGWTFDWHRHRAWELTAVIEGAGTRFTGDLAEPFAAGDLCLLPPGMPHTWLSRPAGSPGEAVVLVVPETVMERLCDLAEGMPLRRLCDRAARGLRFPAPAAEPLIARLVDLVADRGLARFGGLLRLLAAVAESDGAPLARHWSPEAGPADRRFAQVLALVEERLDDPPTQPEIAAAVGMTPAAFSRFFRRAAGRTFVGYLGRRRIAAACQDLIETDDRILDIALRRGWQGLAAFNRRFRRITGRTPSAWRGLARDR
ncbi:MAG: hypothetical protein RLZZ127_95 [Planctomycetota bacterium]|jgi:AraC-like DNA-binding protein/quercetin dioxygenase-like cupin family protein